MNNDTLLPFQRLDIYLASKELARRAHEARIRDAELRDQATACQQEHLSRLVRGIAE